LIPLPSPFKRGRPKDASLFVPRGKPKDAGAFFARGSQRMRENSKPLSLKERGLERGFPDPDQK